ncbi:MAG: D-alanine--D-alanine ligase [Phycisphaerales bacterium]|jgi:D-alanine-D-alanine ligase|nr:D-alanine--D-alanine ligase [Phycisphaerales bacterium]
MASQLRITVLRGGPSAEREVSLVSGGAVANGLRQMGHLVFESDITPDHLAALDQPADLVFPVLHGAWGESGELQEILEGRKLPFVGSGSAASRLGMNKAQTKLAWELNGLPTPSYQVLSRQNRSADIPVPCAVKALDSGSSIDVYICHTSAEAHKAIDAILAKQDQVLVEQFIKGPELTIGLLEEEPLAPIRIVAKRAFFDYEAKYRSSDTEHRFDTGLPAEVVESCRQLAKKANEIVGARDLSRIDLMLDEKNNPYLLEINTLPGFTPKSLLPEAAAHAGIAFGPLVDRLARRAFARSQ